jgi:2-methylcitrate dehydratase PrpD
MQETQTLAQFVLDTAFSDLPDTLVAECRTAILDTFAAGFIGAAQPWAQRAVALARDLGGAPEATVIHQPWRIDASRAAFANGALIGAFECEPLTGSHACGTVLPAALALAERLACDGERFITALVLGFEISARIARTAVGLESVRGFHNPGTQGPFGAAAAAGKLLQFDAAQLVSALGLAGSCSAGLLEFAWSGADTKRLHLGRASQLGLESALLAQNGLQGPSTVLEGRYGYFNAFSEPTDLAPLIDGLGAEWAIQPPRHKSYATHVTHQAVVQAIQDWKRAHGIGPEAVRRVAITGAPRIMEPRHAVRDPTNVMGGQYSLPFTAAVALTRDMSNPLVYDQAAVDDPVVRDLAKRLELRPDASARAEHGGFPATVIIETGEQTFSLPTEPFKGSASNPMTWSDACEKFRRYTQPFIKDDRAQAIIEVVAALPGAADLRELTRLIAAAS